MDDVHAVAAIHGIDLDQDAVPVQRWPAEADDPDEAEPAGDESSLGRNVADGPTAQPRGPG